MTKVGVSMRKSPMRHAAALALGLLALAGCDSRAKEWTGWVYPDSDNLAHSISISGMKSFEACQEAAISRLRALPDPDAGDYECGFRCKWNADYGTNVCKETRK